MANINHTPDENCSSCKLIKLITAINNGDKATLKAFCKDTHLINSLDSCGWTPLMHAVKRGDLESVKILCHCGATANVKDGHFRTPLMMASSKGFTNIVQFLVTKTFDLNVVDVNGMSAFMHAAKNGNLDVVAELFDNGIDVSLKDKNGFTAFMLASIEHHNEIVEFFHQKEVKVDKSDEEMWNYYLDKVVKKNMEDIRKLRESGAVVSVFCPADMCDHPFIELLQKSGCRISNSKERRSPRKQMHLNKPTDEVRHQHEPCRADGLPSGEDETLSGADELLSSADELPSGADGLPSGEDETLSGADELLSSADELPSGADGLPSGEDETLSGADELLSSADELLSEIQDGFTRTSINFTSEKSTAEYTQDKCQDEGIHSPVLRKKSLDACGTAVLDLKMPTTYTSLQDEDIREETSNKVNELICLQPSEERLMNFFSNYKESRNTKGSVDETKATYNKETENYVSAEDGEVTVVRRVTNIKGQSNRRFGFYSPSMVCPTRKCIYKPKQKANTLPRVKNVNVYVNFDVKNVEYLATDRSEIIVNKGM